MRCGRALGKRAGRQTARGYPPDWWRRADGRIEAEQPRSIGQQEYPGAGGVLGYESGNGIDTELALMRINP